MKIIAEKLNEMTQVLESANGRLEEENRTLKEENQKLICQNIKLKMKMKEENRIYDIKFSSNIKLLVKVSILVCALFGLMNTVCQIFGLSDGMQLKMLD